MGVGRQTAPARRQSARAHPGPRARTTNPYKTLATATTSATGYYNKVVYFDFGRPQDLRVAYRTPYQTIGSDFYRVGIARNP